MDVMDMMASARNLSIAATRTGAKIRRSATQRMHDVRRIRSRLHVRALLLDGALFALLSGAVAMLLIGAQRLGMLGAALLPLSSLGPWGPGRSLPPMRTSMPDGHCPLTVPCLLICFVLPAGAIVLVALTLRRAARSAWRQFTQTRAALQPLLTLPSLPLAAAPADLTELLRALRLERRVRILANSAPIALCYGLLRPRLLLSTGLLERVSSAELEAVVRHEHAHLCRRDPLRLLLVRALADMLPARATLRAAAVTTPIAQELAADRAALAVVGAEVLGSALLKVGEALGRYAGRR